MKHTLLITTAIIITALMLVVGCSKDGVDTLYDENGRKTREVTYKDGEVVRNIYYYENGLKKYEDIRKDDFRDGLYTAWHENGQKKEEGTYKDGKENGKQTYWYENGQKKEEVTFKDGELGGLETWWYENGQKWLERTYKDGEYDGLWTEWYENGQKWCERTYKDGKEIEATYWDEDGNEL